MKLVDKIHLKFSDKNAFYQNKTSLFMIDPKDNLILNAIEKIPISYGMGQKV